MAAKKKNRNLLEDPRYADFVDRYHADPLRFAVEVTGFMPSEDQNNLFQAIVDPDAKVSVVSGTGCFGAGTMMMKSDGVGIAVEDIRVGDRLMGPDGNSVRNVLELKRGREAMYRFTYRDGTQHVFNESHILCLTNLAGKLWNDGLLTATVREWNEWDADKRSQHWCYRWTPNGYVPLSIASVEPLGEGDYFGFVLDGDSRFLGYDFTVLHNTGKTASFARIALWHLLCFPVAFYEGKVEVGSNTYIGAPFIQQVADGVWKELQDTRIAISNGPHAWINDFFTITKTRVHVVGYAEQWFVTQIAMKKGEAIGVAGKHRYWQLIIIDEAAGVPDEHFDVIDGTQTQAGNRTLMASQGARSAGRFYDSHHTLSAKNGGSWLPLRFNSERSPFVTTKWLKEREEESGGRHSVEYQIRVLGLFAQSSSNVLLTRADIEDAFSPRKIIQDNESFGLIVLSDVALGEYRDDSVAIVAKVIGDADHGPDARRVEYIEVPIAANDKNEIDFAGDLVNLFGRLDNATLYVDAGGVGATVCKLIERSGVPVVKVNWGVPCFKNEYRQRFYNLRACAMVRFRDAVRQGRVVLPQNISKKLREKIVDQGSRLPYHFSEAGGLRYVMESKENMRKDGIKSPDLIDAMSFAFLEGATYIASGGVSQSLSTTKAIIEAAEDLFAEV